MAACFLRADSTAICDCIRAFGLNDLLWDLTHCVDAFRDGAKRGSARPSPGAALPHAAGQDALLWPNDVSVQ